MLLCPPVLCPRRHLCPLLVTVTVWPMNRSGGQRRRNRPGPIDFRRPQSSVASDGFSLMDWRPEVQGRSGSGRGTPSIGESLKHSSAQSSPLPRPPRGINTGRGQAGTGAGREADRAPHAGAAGRRDVGGGKRVPGRPSTLFWSVLVVWLRLIGTQVTWAGQLVWPWL